MMKTLNKILFLLTMLITFSAGTALAQFGLQDSLYVKPINIEPGTTETLEFCLYNTDPYYGFQANVKLPANLDFVKDEKEKPIVTLDASRTDGEKYQLVTNLKNGILHIAAFSASDSKPINVGTGTIFTIEVEASDAFRGGYVNISSIRCVNSEEKDVMLKDGNSYIGVLPISVSLKETFLSLEEGTGEKAFLEAVVSPDYATDKSLVWSSENEEVATVDQSGEVTAVNPGNTTITVKTVNGKTDVCKVIVGQPVRLLEISPEEKALKVGEDFQINVTTLEPTNAVDQTISWHSDHPEYATVDENGYVTAVGIGVAEITATANGGNNVTASCTVTVEPTPAESVKIEPASAELMVGQSLELAAEVLPESTSDKTLTWKSSNPEIATVDEFGNVTAVALGQAIITATCGDAEGTCVITVIPTPATRITLDKDKAELKAGETVIISATVLPDDTTDKTVIWTSSDDTIATVDENGKVTAVAVGEAIITAQCGEAKATCTITVIPTPVESISLDKVTAELKVGESEQLIATVLPDNATDKTVTWTSSDESIAIVDTNGEVTAVALGESIITATANDGSGIKATCVVTVVATPAESVTIEPASLDLKKGETFTLTATINPEGATDKSVTWTTNDATVATVSDNGEVTGINKGTVTITVTTSNGKIANCIVNVTIPVEEIQLPESASIEEGSALQLYAVVVPEDASETAITWESDNLDVASVDANGVVTGIAPGEARITASCGGCSATCVLTVTPKFIPVGGIMLNKDSEVMVEGESFTLIATVTPENATDKTIGWTSSEETIATVDSNGEVVAIAPGETIITASCGNYSATCVVTVTPKIIVATAITLDKERVTLKIGEITNITATVTPEDTTDKTVIWTSSDQTIATVDNNGVVTATGIGEVTIIASCGEASARCQVSVVPTPAESISLSQYAASLEIGQTVKLIATVFPETATDKTVAWTSANEEIATVDENGTVLAKALGEVDILARCGNATAICKVTVVPTIIGSISLSNSSLYMIVGDKTDLTATIFPPNATDLTLFWKSSDESIVTVEGSGMTIEVSALKAGTTQITVSSKEGISATCDVTVSIIAVEQILLDKTELNLTEGDSDTLTATVLPENATDKSVTWKSSDVSVATVSDNGEVTAVGVGTAVIYASSSNGITAECKLTVKALIIEATSVTINTDGVTLRVGQEQQLNATVSPANITNPQVTWKSSDESIATVDASGKVTALTLGETIITATCGASEGKCKINVVPTPVESITLSNTTLTLKEGELTDLIAIINPADATDKTLTWSSSDETVIAVAENAETTIENGVKLDVKALKAGTATITVLSPNEGKSAACVVTVNPILAESISLDKDILNLIEGDADSLIATIYPDNASDKTVTWKSSDTSVATVSNQGEVRAIAAGIATIYASTSNGLTAECKVEVAARIIYAVSVTLDKETADMEVGDKLTLNATINPDNVSDPTLTWTTSDEAIATVDKDGNVTAVALGQAVITTACGDASASCRINVVPTPATDMSLSQYQLLLREGHTADLIAIVRPDKATDKSVVWKSSDESIVTVDANGIVTAIKKGVAVITATTNTTISRECEVTVVPDVIPVAKIEIVEKPQDGSSIEFDKEETRQLTARIEPENATDKTITWKSSNEDTATVTADGKVTAIKEGSAVIYASSSNGLTDECPITVLPGIIPVESISLSNTTLLLDEGTTTNLIAIVHPDNATDKEVMWTSSDERVAIVDHEGNITAISEGTATITATSHYDSSIYKTCEVTVEKEDIIVPVRGIEIIEKPSDGSALELEKEVTIQLHAKIEPEDATDKSVTWKSSDPSIATVADDGRVTTLRSGDVTIYASSSNGLTDEIHLTVLRGIVPVEKITLSNTELLLRAGAISNLIAIIYPDDADDKEVIWTSSDESIATVDQNGNIIAAAAGTAVITAASHFDPTIRKECVVNVSGIIAVEDLLLSREELTMTEGDIETLKATILPDNAADKTVTWKSSDRSAATVDESGVVAAVAPGTAIIYASSSNGITKECKVTVKAKIIAVTSITIDKDKATLEVGESVVLNPTITPENATDKTLKWVSSDESIASVDQDGKVTGNALGNVIITVTCGEVSANCEVEVVPTMPTGITLTNSELTLTEGATSDLIAIVDPDKATDKTVVWTTDNAEVASVDEHGIVTAIKPGNTIVTATTINGLTATCTVTVVPIIINPSDITLDKELTLTEGETYTLTAVVTPDNATDKTITWRSSNTSIATVDDGKVTAINVGNTVIFASTSNGKTAECNVTVEARIIPVSSITLDIEEAEMHVGEQILITPTVAPDNATDKSIIWKSSDTTVATVDENGHVTALALGETTITASCGEVSAACLVKVVAIEPTGITLSNTELTLIEGSISDLIAIVAPDNATDKTVTWTSNDESIATVDDQGIVTAIKEGTATIVAMTHNDLKAYCVVTVVPVPVQQPTGISLNKTSLELYVDESEPLTATVTPEDVADKTVTWISLDQSVATVSSEGVVTAVTPGKTLIMASSANGLSVTCEVTVKLSVFDDGILRYRVLTDDTVEVIGLVDPESVEVAINTEAIYTSPNLTLEFTVTKIAEDAFIEDETLKKLVLFTVSIPEIEGNPFSSNTTIYVADPEEYKKNPDWGILPNTIKGYVTIQAPAENPILTPEGTIQISSDIVIKNHPTVWTSSHPAIASVDEQGLITMHYVGHTTITATCNGYSDSFVMPVYPQRGDANWDGVVNVADPVNIANYVVKKYNNLINWIPTPWDSYSSWTREYWDGFYDVSSDINGQEGITVSDASETVSIILNQTAEQPANMRIVKVSENLEEEKDALEVGKAIAADPEGYAISVLLADSREYVALQADIKVASPLTIENVKTGKRAYGHKLSMRRIDGQTMRIVLFDLNNSAFADKGEAILEIIVDGNPESEDAIEITNIVAADVRSNAYSLDMRRAEGLNGIEIPHSDDISIRTIGNNLIISHAKGRHISVCTMEGAVIKMQVAGSDEEIISLTKGIYIVTVDNKTAKFAIKQ